MLSASLPSPPPQLPSPLPRRIDSLSNNVPTQPILESREDAKYARLVLTAVVTDDEDKALRQSFDEEDARRHENHTRELTETLGRMTGWVEELVRPLRFFLETMTYTLTSPGLITPTIVQKSNRARDCSHPCALQPPARTRQQRDA